MTPADLNAIRSRIDRAFATAQTAAGTIYETSHQTDGVDFTTRFRAYGVKAPEQLEDDFLNLFIWTWSLKDYLKVSFERKGLLGSDVEGLVNHTPALCLVADIANRAKHGSLKKSRSNEFAELVKVGFDVPQNCIDSISVAGSDIVTHVRDPELVNIRATIRTCAGVEHDALAVLNAALHAWERQAIARIVT